MENNNIFKIGDEVVAITNHKDTTLKKDKIYTVNKVLFCKKCGAQSIDVKEKYTFYIETIESMCSKCYTIKTTIINNKSCYHNSSRFQKLDDLTISSEELNSQLETILKPILLWEIH